MKKSGKTGIWMVAVLLVAALAGCGKNVDKSDTVRWINGTQALQTKVNGWDYTVFGGTAVDENTVAARKEFLIRDWEAADRDSADEAVDWLLGEGHRTSFVERMEFLKEGGVADVTEEGRADFIYGHYELTEEEARRYAQFYKAYGEKGADAVSAWDYSRAVSVLADGYVAGYYTKEEALDRCMEIAGMMQGMYGSWDAFIDSYLLGYEYYAEESSGGRREIYAEIKEAEDSPYRLDWNLALKKKW